MTIESISPQDAYLRLSRAGDGVLIDVRTGGEYASGHARGATLIPLNTISTQQITKTIGDVRDKTVYLICKSGGRSSQAASRLLAEGMSRVVNVAGGTDAWKRAGLPMDDEGRRVLPLDRQVQMVAGGLALVGALLGFFVQYWFFLLPTVVGFGMFLAGATGFCPMAHLVALMPWNRAAHLGTSCCATNAKQAV